MGLSVEKTLVKLSQFGDAVNYGYYNEETQLGLAVLTITVSEYEDLGEPDNVVVMVDPSE